MNKRSFHTLHPAYEGPTRVESLASEIVHQILFLDAQANRLVDAADVDNEASANPGDVLKLYERARLELVIFAMQFGALHPGKLGMSPDDDEGQVRGE